MDETDETLLDLETIVRDAKDDQKLELRLWLRMLSTTKLMSQEIRRRLRTEFSASLADCFAIPLTVLSRFVLTPK